VFIKNNIYLIPLLFIVVINGNTNDINAAEIKLGKASIQIPAPKGFVDLSTISKEQFKIFENVIPETNRLHCAFISERDVGQLMLDKPPTYGQYYMIQSSKEFDNLGISISEFTAFRKMLSKEYATTFDQKVIDASNKRVGKYLTDNYGNEVKFNINGIAPLGVYGESNTHITISFLSKTELSIDGDVEKKVIAASGTCLLIEDKVIYLYVYSSYKDWRDLEWTRVGVKEWLNRVLSVN